MLVPVLVPLAAEVDEGLGLVPGGLIEIEGVLAEGAVEGHQALLVLPMLAPLVPAVGGEVEQVPHVGGPKPGPRLDHSQHVLVVQALVLLGVVPLLGTAAVEGGVGVCPVFGEAHDLFGVLLVELVEEPVRLLHVAQIPAEVQVVAVHVGNVQDGAVGLQHEDVGHGGLPSGVHLVAQVVEEPMVL